MEEVGRGGAQAEGELELMLLRAERPLERHPVLLLKLADRSTKLFSNPNGIVLLIAVNLNPHRLATIEPAQDRIGVAVKTLFPGLLPLRG